MIHIILLPVRTINSILGRLFKCPKLNIFFLFIFKFPVKLKNKSALQNLNI